MNTKNGFTLIEMIVVISILGLVGAMATGFLFTSLMGNTRSEILKEVRHNGAYALGVMESLIINAKSVSCPTSTNILLTDFNDNQTNFLCSENKISSKSAVLDIVTNFDLTGSTVTVSQCQFSCSASLGQPVKVAISFLVSQRGTGDLKPAEKSSVLFQTEVLSKNF